MRIMVLHLASSHNAEVSMRMERFLFVIEEKFSGANAKLFIKTAISQKIVHSGVAFACILAVTPKQRKGDA